MSQKQGYIKLHRSIMSWRWYKNINIKVLFVHLMLTVNHAQQQWEEIEIYPGETVTSIAKLAEDTGLSIQQVRTSLQKLKNTKEIDVVTTNKYTLIKVRNWHRYQKNDSEANNNQITNRQQIANNEKTTNNKEKNNKNVKRECELNSKREFIKPSVAEVEEYACNHNLPIEAKAFISYYEAKGWRVGATPMTNWQAAVELWALRERNGDKCNSVVNRNEAYQNRKIRKVPVIED